uniref:protein-serine/threonine phosphatase n=1 Tax=Oryza punctata TaxID=4537 RepID=A0A0E0LE43_ORYPU
MAERTRSCEFFFPTIVPSRLSPPPLTCIVLVVYSTISLSLSLVFPGARGRRAGERSRGGGRPRPLPEPYLASPPLRGLLARARPGRGDATVLCIGSNRIEGTFVKMGVYLSTPKTEKLSEDGENDKLKFGLSSMQGWRATMEDAHSALLDLDNDTSFFGVFDGHGGRVVAKFCAKYLHREVLRSEAYSAGDLGTAAHKAFFRMDEMMRGQRGWRELQALGDKINQISGMIEGLIWSPRGSDSNDQHDDWAFEEGPHSDFAGPTCGSTACVAIVRNNQLVVANAGDSRCVISRNGQAYNLSRDHKPELEAERERILKAGGYIQMGRVNGTINLSRAIGDIEFKQNKFLSPDKQMLTANPDINTVELCDDDDFLVLACDGIWDCMSSQQLVDFIHEHINTESSLSAVCERVLDRCLAPSTLGGEGCDNMTMILVQFKKPVSQNKNASPAEQSAANKQPTGDTQWSEIHVTEESSS